MKKPIGRIIATEKVPTTMDKSLGETNILNGYVVLQTHKVGKFILAQMMMAQ